MAARDFTMIIGAGTSKAVGLPQFEDLRTVMVEGLCKRAGEEDLASTLLPRAEALAPEMFFALFESEHAHVFQFLSNVLTARPPGPAQALLATAVSDGAVVWTLNFDTLIEDAASGVLSRVVYPDEPGDMPEGGQLLKPHGSIDARAPASNDAESPLVITSKQMLGGMSELWRDRLVQDIADREVIVWGYAGNDLDVMPALIEAFDDARSVVWVAFSPEDRASAHQRFDGSPNIRIFEPDLDGDDPSAEVVGEVAGLLGLDVPDIEPDKVVRTNADWAYEPVSLAAVANALGQMSKPRLARRVWWRALRQPGSSATAVQKLGRSYLFDAPAVQVVALPVLNVAAAVSPARIKPLVWDCFLTAREGRGATGDGDRLADRVDQTFGDAEHADGTAVDVHARVVAQLRLQGNLTEANRRAQALYANVTSTPDRAAVSQFMLGRVLYETIGLDRRLGHLDRATAGFAHARDPLRQPHIGFLWSAWILDEGAALALASGNYEEARDRNVKSCAMFANLGMDERYRFDANLRAAEIDRHANPEDAKPISDLDELLHRASSNRQLSTPYRLAEVHLELADAHRVAGRTEAARSHAEAARRSPSAVQRAIASFEMAMLAGPPVAGFVDEFTALGISPRAAGAPNITEPGDSSRGTGDSRQLVEDFHDRTLITR